MLLYYIYGYHSVVSVSSSVRVFSQRDFIKTGTVTQCEDSHTY